jgi:ubiquinone/menaquinone biosynthesis C-methylase UbiE
MTVTILIAPIVVVGIWSERDQADNRPAVMLRNADLEGVRNRVRLCDGDARALPFADASFDVVVSSLAIHNIAARTDRARALQEIACVLRPAGRILIIDIVRTAEYARVLRAAHFGEVQSSGPNFMFLAPVHALTAIRQ